MAYNAVNQFCALCEASGTFLQTSNPQPQMIQLQVENLLRNMDRFRNKPEARDPKIFNAIQNLPLPVEEKHRMILKLSEIAAENVAATGNAGSFQDWTSWPWFMTEAKCAEFKALNSDEERLMHLVRTPYRLGLRSPSESTLRTLTAVHLTLTGSADLDSHQKKAVLDGVKGAFRRLHKSSTAPPPVHIAVLPPTPAALRDSHQQLYLTVFGNDPKFVEIDEMSWQPFVASIPMRLTRRDVRQQQPLQVNLQSGPNDSSLLGNGGNSLQALAVLAQQLGPLLNMTLQQNFQHTGALQMQQQQDRQQRIPQYQLRGFSAKELALGDKPKDLPTATAAPLASADAGSADKAPAIDLPTATAALVASASAASASKTGGGCKKRPAANANARAKAKCKAPKAKSKANKLGAPSMTKAARVKARPEGCPKCRGKPGCTPSCWKQGTYPW